MRVPELVKRLQTLPDSRKQALVRFRYVGGDSGTFREEVARIECDSTGVILHGPDSVTGDDLDVNEYLALNESEASG